MSNIWKAVTGFFQAKEKMEEEKKEREQRTVSKIPEDANDLNEEEDDGSDSEDEDFVPNEANDGALSEELSDDDVDDDETKTEKKKAGRKNGTGSSTRRKRKSPKKPSSFINGRPSKRGRFAEDPSDDKISNDKDEDEEFLSSEEKSFATDNSEEVEASQEAQEKAETDKLWADFLTSVDEEKAKRNSLKKERERTVVKVVNKVYDFAGERVSVQEKVKVTVTNSERLSSSSSSVVKNGRNDDELVSSSSFLKDMESAKKKTPVVALDRDDGEPQPGPSSAMKNIPNGSSIDKSKTSPVKAPPPVRKRKGGISILGNDPELIGLDELDKRGLSGLLKAFKNVQSKKIGTLEKSKLDWESYKRQQGLEEELHNHNRSKDTYIDKQEFLNRADHRQFEIEKSMRATQRSKRLAN